MCGVAFAPGHSESSTEVAEMVKGLVWLFLHEDRTELLFAFVSVEKVVVVYFWYGENGRILEIPFQGMEGSVLGGIIVREGAVLYLFGLFSEWRCEPGDVRGEAAVDIA